MGAVSYRDPFLQREDDWNPQGKQRACDINDQAHDSPRTHTCPEHKQGIKSQLFGCYPFITMSTVIGRRVSLAVMWAA